MDKMFIKLDQKEVPYKPEIILDKVTIGEETCHLVENMATIVLEDMEEVEVILEEVAFKEGPVVILEEIIVEIEIERIVGLGDSLDQEKEE